MKSNQSSGEENPLVSLVITSFNRANWIAQTVKSALAQTYENIEVVISDNASTDTTPQVIAPFLTDSRVRYFQNETNIGMVANFRLAIEQRSRGKFFVPLSSDDYLADPEFVAKAVECVQQHPTVGLVISKPLNLDERTGRIEQTELNENLYNTPFVSGEAFLLGSANSYDLSWAGVMIRRDLFCELDVFSKDIKGFDLLTALLMALRADVGVMNRASYVMRHHSGNATARTLTAEELVAELAYIEVPYQAALKDNKIARQALDGWREKMLAFVCRVFCKRLYLANRHEYLKFRDHLRLAYPQTLRSIESRKDWVLFKWAWRFPQLTHRPLRKLKHLFDRARSSMPFR